MKLLLERKTLNDEYTIGELSLDGVFFCFTCEDAVRDKKIKGKTAIPYGTYDVTLTWSNRFQKVLPLVNDVPNFEGIRIHAGNTAEDTEGCILVGLTKLTHGVGRSRDAMDKLMPILHAEKDCGGLIDLEVV
jgi:hypothetical protein